jgi:hypothetical protein
MNRLGEPPEDYLRQCSNTSLRYFEMSKLEHVANLRRELTVLLEEMMEESALALFARWMLEKRSLPEGSSGNGNAAKSAESRRARSLLADFIRDATLLPGSPRIASRSFANRDEAANGQIGRPGDEDLAADAAPGVAGMISGNGNGAAKGHLPPQRGVARAERRRTPRPARTNGRPPEGTP